ncbi:MAG TPA: lytic transglycosylase domain-containing protein [Burkholderiales bacterium]|nr:lytic transglycosylase domain-containing protein [Burkholderiales bacterium]
MVPSNQSHVFAIVGAGALLFLASEDASAPYIESLALQSCIAEERPELPEAQAPEPPDELQRALIEHLSRRFMIAAEATERMVAAAHRAARRVGLDPLLVLAVISIESRFNPIAESGMGAKGLMQIIPKYHLAKLRAHGGEDAVLDPESNILVGTQILQEYVHRTGSLEAGLQFYNGAFWDGSAQYAQKVMAERERLEQACARALSRHRCPWELE